MIQWAEPTWEVAPRVRGLTTLRTGGVSLPPYHSLNLGMHVGDVPEAVAENRRLLAERLRLPQAIHWLNQVHGKDVIEVVASPSHIPPIADGSYTSKANQVLAIMTADCLPLFLAAGDGTEVALLHCGWRGIANGIIEQSLKRFSCPRQQLHAWLGPAIGPRQFEVGADVKAAMAALSPPHKAFFTPSADRWRLHLFALVAAELNRLGVQQVQSSDLCTVENEDKFFSYRRDGETGRIVSLLWIAND